MQEYTVLNLTPLSVYSYTFGRHGRPNVRNRTSLVSIPAIKDIVTVAGRSRWGVILVAFLIAVGRNIGIIVDIFGLMELSMARLFDHFAIITRDIDAVKVCDWFLYACKTDLELISVIDGSVVTATVRVAKILPRFKPGS